MTPRIRSNIGKSPLRGTSVEGAGRGGGKSYFGEGPNRMGIETEGGHIDITNRWLFSCLFFKFTEKN